MNKYKFEFNANKGVKYCNLVRDGIEIKGIDEMNNALWVKYEDVKSLELQVMTLTEQLRKMERRQSKQFNINDCVRVKLTDLGKDVYYHQYDETNDYYDRQIFKPHYPAVDKEGYTEFQLWELMKLYGTYCSNDCDLPFETNITLCDC
jgi:hypothetical protein